MSSDDSAGARVRADRGSYAAGRDLHIHITPAPADPLALAMLAATLLLGVGAWLLCTPDAH
jgi:hypothetical protein